MDASGLDAAACLCVASALVVTPDALARGTWQLRLGAANRSTAVLVVVAVSAIASIVVAVVAPNDMPIVVAGLVVGVTVVVRTYLARAQRTSQRERRSWMLALDSIAADLRGGLDPRSAFAVDAHDDSAGLKPGRAREVFRSAAARAGLGAGLGDSFALAAADPSNSVLRREIAELAAACRLAEMHGLSLARLSDVVVRDLQGQVTHEVELLAELAGPRASAHVLAVLPVVGVLLGQAIGAQPLHVLFGPGAGPVLLIAGIVLCCIGLIWCDRLAAGAMR